MRWVRLSKTYPAAISLKKCSANTLRGPLPASLRAIDFSPVDRYPELRELEIKEFASTLLSGGPGRASRALEGKIWEYTRGELPHAKHAISALYGLIESDKPVEEIPLPVATSSDQQAPSEDWAGLKKALTSSLTSGTFLDSQFYAVESRSSTGFPKSCPVYFSSMVGGSLVSELTACKSPAQVMCGWAADPPF